MTFVVNAGAEIEVKVSCLTVGYSAHLVLQHSVTKVQGMTVTFRAIFDTNIGQIA